MKGLLHRALVLIALLLAGSAFAQSLDDVDVRPQGENRVVRIRFNASVGFITLLPSSSSDLYTLRFEMLSEGRRDAAGRTRVPKGRRYGGQRRSSSFRPGRRR